MQKLSYLVEVFHFFGRRCMYVVCNAVFVCTKSYQVCVTANMRKVLKFWGHLTLIAAHRFLLPSDICAFTFNSSKHCLHYEASTPCFKKKHPLILL